MTFSADSGKIPGSYRVCKSFTVESGHMLSKHPEKCKYPHGHTRKIELVLVSSRLDANEMVVDFKVIKLIAQDYIRRYDHRMAINSADPLLPSMRQVHPDSLVVFEGKDPTTEVIAKDIFDFVASRLAQGFTGKSESGVEYTLEPDRVALERVRVYETATSWAEFSV